MAEPNIYETARNIRKTVEGLGAAIAITVQPLLRIQHPRTRETERWDRQQARKRKAKPWRYEDTSNE